MFLKAGPWRWMLGVPLVLGLWLAGCAPPPQAPVAQKETGAPAGAVAKPAPRPGGIIQIGARQTPQTLNPLVGGTIGEGISLGLIFERLLNYEMKPEDDVRAEFKVVPWLAERWEQPNDTTYIFHLRKDVKWQDGQPFTADDVVWSFGYMRDPQNAFKAAGYLQGVNTIEKVDQYTVRVALKEPSPVFLQGLAQYQTGMPFLMAKHVFDRGDKYEKVVIGTGPFKLVSYDPTAGMVLEKNKDYWLKGKPYVDGIRIFYGMDPSAMMAAFKVREIDIHSVGDKAQLDAIKAIMPEVQFVVGQGMFGNSLNLRMDRPPYSDIRVRRALHLAVDRQAMIKTLTFGMGVINPPAMSGAKKGWVIPEDELTKLPGYRQPKDQDIAEAKRLLAEAGYPNGFKSVLRLPGTRMTSVPIAEMAAGQMKSIGIDMTIDKMEFGAFNVAEMDGDFEALMILATSANPEEPLYNFFHSKGNRNNYIRDPKLDGLIDSYLTSLDEKKRKEAFLGIQRQLLDQLYAIPTIELANFPLWQPYVHDFVANWGGQAYLVDPTQVWLDVDKMPKR